MELSLYLARLFGVYLVLEGLVLLVRQGFLHRVLRDLVRTTALRYLIGILVVLAGASIVFYHNIWQEGYVGLVTLIGWLLLVKGVLYLFIPERTLRNLVRALDKRHWYVVFGVFCMAVGLYLVKMGFAF
ncbi:MAG: hypothetical protein COV07_01925 [Candidatus Vogelbacteria bacterium CG10_big_fil_rev_8_21_14_0_10_45_14]|uniref:DUF2065 domain-containing protein n=1 Tax=Candidatus Vogelbacteria bacterium CG10_big_fil_rev_8_21_14_0_10_45_14 TaxID=1975042 RepID=A0A2H0RK16_9BACT|nr:MAG: hypothetical protein COV07_01925 [Candidatus Vogelbacteria bacterium CG10_big_fil_rev_8_21_14_0_10_45_14]